MNTSSKKKRCSNGNEHVPAYWDTKKRTLLYAVALELTEVGLVLLMLGLSVEALIPDVFDGSLIPPFFLGALSVLILTDVVLGRMLRAPFPYIPKRSNPLTWIGIIWIAFLITLYSARISTFLAPISIGIFFFLAYRFFGYVRKKSSK